VRRIATFAAGLGFVLAVTAADAPRPAVYVAELSSLYLVPREPGDISQHKDTSVSEILIDNSCGRFRARFSVRKTISGPPERELEVTGIIGEWCRLPFEASLSPLALWLVRNGKGWKFIHSLPAHEMGPSQYAVVPLDGIPCVDVGAKEAWSVIQKPVFLGTTGTFSAESVSSLRKLDALVEEGDRVYARKAVLLTDGFGNVCSYNRWSGP